MSETIYAGPGKVYIGTLGLQPDGVNGAIKATVDEKTSVRASAMYGEMFETLDDVTGKITTTPFDNWNLLPTLLPTFLGVTTAVGTGFGSGVLAIGTNPFTGTKVPVGVYTPDGRLYNFVRGAITKHPAMKFLPGAPLFSEIEISALGDLAKNPGDSAFLITGNAITESGATDPDTTGFGVADYGQTHWTAAWGSIAGFTGMEAEDGWELVSDVKYNFYTVQKVTRLAKLSSARFMLKGRIVGPTHTQLLGKVLAHTSGGILTEGSSTDLVLTGSNSKAVTLKNCEVKGAGFEFGGTKLGTGEIGFVTNVVVSGGVAPASLIFSA